MTETIDKASKVNQVRCNPTIAVQFGVQAEVLINQQL